MVAQPALLKTATMAQSVLAASRWGAQAIKQAGQASVRLVDHFPRELVDDIFAFALKKQTGVSLKYMLDFGSKPIERQLILSAQFLHNELPVRLSHRVAELENLPYGLSAKPHVLKVRDWYVESFRELRGFPKVKDASDELQFTRLLQHIYRRHANVVPVMAMGVAELKRELAQTIGIDDLPDIHQFLDNFYLSRIGIRMLIGQHIALHEPPVSLALLLMPAIGQTLWRGVVAGAGRSCLLVVLARLLLPPLTLMYQCACTMPLNRADHAAANLHP
jgi:pyruvate dehydrogenase kinase 2/3/4